MSAYVFQNHEGHTLYDDGLGNVFGSMHEAMESFRREAAHSPREIPPTLSDAEIEWIKIIRAAKNNPGLTDLLNQVKEFYILGANNG